jgi:hypothetical protein
VAQARDDEEEQQVPGVEALHAEQRVGHVRVLDDSGEQNEAAEPPIPVFERIDRDDQHKQPQEGQSNHAGARSSLRLVGPPRLSPVGRGRDARSQTASGEPLNITPLRQRPRSLTRERIAPTGDDPPSSRHWPRRPVVSSDEGSGAEAIPGV